MAQNRQAVTRIEREEWVRIVSNPQNGYEWSIALSDPYSPIYKEFVAELVEHEEFHVIQLLENIMASMQSRTEAKIEEAERYARKLASDQETMQIMMRQPKSDMPKETPIKGESVYVLEALHKALIYEVSDLERQQETKQQEVDEVKQELKEIDKSWQLRRAAKAVQFIKRLQDAVSKKEDKAPFVDKDNKPIELNRKLVEKVKKVIENVASPTKIAKVHPQVKSDQVCATNDLVCEFNMHKAIQGMDDDKPFDPSAFLKALVANKKCMVVKSDEKDNEVAQSAIDATKHLNQADAECKAVGKEILQKRKLLNNVVDELNALGKRPKPPGQSDTKPGE